jgi:FKBP-type peptidyl-prolyl cis-trans isomerase
VKRQFAVLGLALALVACGPRSKAAQDNLSAANVFMAANAKAPGVVTLPDGLQYKVVTSGPAGGVSPKAEDEVKVHYEGRLLGPAGKPLEGQVFDSSFQRGEPADFPQLGGLIPAWVEALQKMHPGDEWLLFVPPQLGYGEEGAGPIPPNSVLIFRVRLIGVMPHAG